MVDKTNSFFSLFQSIADTKGVIMDKKLCRHYGLKSRKGSQDDE